MSEFFLLIYTLYIDLDIGPEHQLPKNGSWFTVIPSDKTIPPHYNQSTTAAPGNSSGSGSEATGCPDAYQWCSYTPIVTLSQFLCGTALICIGYPTGNVMSYALFSKILGPKPQVCGERERMSESENS